MVKRFSEEFKKEAVDLILIQGMKANQVCEDLGVSRASIDKWLKIERDRNKDPESLNETERNELKRLRKETHVLRMERDLLKKTAIYFAKTTQEGVNS